mmetsp:Transcript_57011/g.129172  ORF Transcript_57011/g.129172 Transcript_57011/m.129172 type:complete len:276 (-) Transcript_57011:60-887(-)
MMDRAASTAFRSSDTADSTHCGRARSMLGTGRDQPMMPVEQGRTIRARFAAPSRPRSPSRMARSAPSPVQMSSDDCSPEPGSPPGHTLEILLLTTMACRGPPSARRLRPTFTGAPGKALVVKSAVQASVGSSSRIKVRLMGRSTRVGSSTGSKVSFDLPMRKPCGRSPWVSRNCWCFTSELNSSSPSSTSSSTSGGSERASPSLFSAALVTSSITACRCSCPLSAGDSAGSLRGTTKAERRGTKGRLGRKDKEGCGEKARNKNAAPGVAARVFIF